VERIRFAQCVEDRLDRIAQVVDEAAVAGRLPPLGDIGSPAFRSWPHGVGDGIVGSEVAAHFDRDELTALSQLNEFFAILGELNKRELDVWTRLYTLVGPGRTFLPGEAAELRLAIGEARLVHRRLALSGIRAAQTADAYRLPYATGPEYIRHIRRRRSDFPICGPIAPIAPDARLRYGQAPLHDIINRALARPVTRP
jgi:hypothetical protein